MPLPASTTVYGVAATAGELFLAANDGLWSSAEQPLAWRRRVPGAVGSLRIQDGTPYFSAKGRLYGWDAARARAEPLRAIVDPPQVEVSGSHAYFTRKQDDTVAIVRAPLGRGDEQVLARVDGVQQLLVQGNWLYLATRGARRYPPGGKSLYPGPARVTPGTVRRLPLSGAGCGPCSTRTPTPSSAWGSVTCW